MQKRNDKHPIKSTQSLIFLLVLSLFLVSCKPENIVPSKEQKTTVKINEQKTVQQELPTQPKNDIVKIPMKIALVELRDKLFLKDSKGLPIAVKIVSDVKLQGNENDNIMYSCKLAYANELTGGGIDSAVKITKQEEATSTITLLDSVEGKLDISRWKACCDLKNSRDFNAISQTTFCSE